MQQAIEETNCGEIMVVGTNAVYDAPSYIAAIYLLRKNTSLDQVTSISFPYHVLYLDLVRKPMHLRIDHRRVV